MGGFYGTGIEIWAGFGLVGINEKKPVLVPYVENISKYIVLIFIIMH